MNIIEQKVKELKLVLSRFNLVALDIKLEELDNYNDSLDSFTLTILLDDGGEISEEGRVSNTKTKIDKNASKLISAKLNDLKLTILCVEQEKKFEIKKLQSKLSATNKSLKDNKNFKTIFKNAKKFGGYTSKRDQITILTKSLGTLQEHLDIVPGLNYRELGHCFYTPSFKALSKEFEDIYFKLDKNTYDKKEKNNIVNILLKITNYFEDGRIENLMILKFNGAMPYFKNTAINILINNLKTKTINDPDEWIDENDCVFICSRKYLDKDIRQWVVNEFINSGHGDIARATRVIGYINKYLTLTWRKNRREMIDLIIGFYLEIEKDLLEAKKKIPRYKQMQDLSDMLDELLKDMETQMNEISDDDDFHDFSELEDEIAEELKNKIKAEGKQPFGKNKKGEKDIEPVSGDTDTDKVMSDAKKELEASKEEIEKKSKEINKSLEKSKLGYDNNQQIDIKKVSPAMKISQKRLEGYFKQLLTMCRNGYITKKRVGSLDVGEARRQEKVMGMRIFKQYKRNQNKAFDVDIAFIMDISASMKEYGGKSETGSAVSKIRKVSEQLWISLTSASAVGGKCKVFTFSNSFCGVITEPKNKSDFVVPYIVEGTIIEDTLFYAKSYLDASNATNKWVVVLTDGELGDVEMHNSIITTMKSKGITAGKLNIGREITDNSVYDHVLNIKGKDSDIVSFFKNIYTISTKKYIKGL